MNKLVAAYLALFLVFITSLVWFHFPSSPSFAEGGEVIKLPQPKLEGEVSVEEAIAKRRSIREYRADPLSLEEVSQLLWAAQGITDPAKGFRAAPSAGATYPIELCLVAGNVSGLEQGLYRYLPREHSLLKVARGDFRPELQRAALGQPWVGQAPALLVFTVVYERTTSRYGERGVKYVHLEVGHAAENVYLQCVSLGLGTVVVGAFSDEEVRKALNITEDPIYLMPVGKL